MATLLLGATQETVVKRVVEEWLHRQDLVLTHLLNMAVRTVLETLQEQCRVTLTNVQVHADLNLFVRKGSLCE